MFSFAGLALVVAALVAWVAVAIRFTVKHYVKGYGPRSFIGHEDIPGIYPGA